MIFRVYTCRLQHYKKRSPNSQDTIQKSYHNNGSSIWLIVQMYFSEEKKKTFKIVILKGTLRKEQINKIGLGKWL